MIDIENKVIDTISKAFEGVATVSSVYVESPEKFPWVYVREMSNSVYARSIDESLSEHHASVSFRIEYYSAATRGAKQEVKALAQIGDMAMQSMKFRRSSFSLIPNYDRTVTRAYADYRAVVGEGVQKGDDVVYQMYR